MSGFFLIAALFLLVALAVVSWPLLHHRGARHRDVVGADDRRGTNVELYRQRLAEIERDRDAGTLDATEAETLTAELAATLLEDADGRTTAVSATPGPGMWAAVAIGIAIVGVSVLLYRSLGAYDAVELGAATKVLNEANADPAALGDLVMRLRTRVAKKPDDAESWYLLGHALMRLDDASGAATAFEHAYARVPDDSGVAVALAHARFIADGGTVSPQNKALMDRILADDPRNAFVLEMLALDAFRRTDYAAAVRYLETALASGDAGARTASLQDGLQKARALLGDAGGPALDVTVELGDAARRMPPTAALFVYARRPGERMPLLVARRSVGEGTMTIRLDRANAMQGDVTLKAGDTLDVAARLSASGSIMPGADDPQARQSGIELAAGVTPVKLALEARPAAGGPPFAAAQVPAVAPPAVPAGDTAAAPADGASIRLAVSFAPGMTAQPPARVFVIARAPNGPPMPIAVRTLDPSALPQEIVLSDRDAMQPGRTLGNFERVEVIARLSRSGNAMRGPDDVESTAQIVDPRAAASATLVIGG